MQISSYKIGVRFQIDNRELRNLDRQMKALEKKFQTFGKRLNKLVSFSIEKFNVNDKKLQTSLGNALDRASNRVVFDITRFAVNDRNMQAALLRASRSMRGGRASGAVARSTLSSDEWDRRRAVDREIWREKLEARREDAASRAAQRMSRSVDGGGVTGRHAVAAGGMGGIAARAYMPALALGMGGFGVAKLNRVNQEVISAQLTTQAVTEAAGLQGQGTEAFSWLRQQGNRIGFSYMDQAQDYNNFLSNSLGAGVGLEQSQDIYLGFAEYARAMGITPARNKLVMNALSQMMGKGTVSMEELRRQMAESMPGTMDVFAEAYAEMTGSGLSGQEALASLYKAVPTGKVQSAQLLPIVQRILRQRAAPKLDVAMKTSQAEQGRFQNAFADKAILASTSGVEEAFSRIFRTLTVGLEESSGLVRRLSSAFNEATKPMERILLFPQSFMRALDGRDSLVADWLGLDATEQLREDWSQLKVLFDQIMGMQTPNWMPTLEATTREIAAMMNTLAGFSQWQQRKAVQGEIVAGDILSEKSLTKEEFEGLSFWEKSKLSLQWGWRTATNAPAKYMATREANNGGDISAYMGPSGFEAIKYWESQKQVARDQATNTFGKNGYNINQPITPNQTNTFNMEFKFESGDPEVIKPWVLSTLADAVEKSMVNWNIKE